MNEESQLKRIVLQVLALVGMVMFWNPKVAAVVALLQAVISDYWDQFYELLRKTPASRRKAVLRAAGAEMVAEMLRAGKVKLPKGVAA